jgi:hypothetical protein
MKLSDRHEGGYRGGFCSLVLLLFLTLCGSARAATVRANTLSLTDVTTAINHTASGDTVMLPGGSATWTGGVTVKKGISIIGAGKDATLITASVSGRTNRRTFTIVASVSQPMFRLSGLTIKGVTGEKARQSNGVIHMTGDAHRFRIDHIKIANLNDSLIRFNGYLWGVVDHCDFETIGAADLVVGHSTWPAPGGVRAVNGNGSWADEPYFGTEKFIFIEDCNFTGSSLYAVDANNGGRYVFRHNFTVGQIGGHGTESTQLARGTRAVEMYENVSDRSRSNNPSLNDKPIHIRSGSYVIFNNVFKWNNNPSIDYYRGHNIFKPWGGSDGTSVWDQSDSKVYESGTVGSASSGASVVLPLSGLTANQYKGYVLRNTSPGTTLRFSTITSNTASNGGASTFTYMGTAGYANQATMSFVGGDHFEIRKVRAGLDAPGRGKGDLLVGDLTTIHNTVTGTASWPRNALEGIYFWNNHNDSSTGPLATLAFGGIPAIEAGLFTTPNPGYRPYVYPHPLTQIGTGNL